MLDAEEVVAISRGQYIRPTAGIPGPAEHYRLRDGDGRLVAIATAAGGRLAPDKVFVGPPSTDGRIRRGRTGRRDSAD